ncbi:MAG: tRNA (adenosine(37)-N6)-dimethylallyltransferase MiaA [Flavobacteriales bacterium]
MNKLIVILGPTAIGKTAFSIELAKHFQTEILSCDSRQFFKEMNIGVARPDISELAAAPHHFIGHISIVDDYSAGRFEQEGLLLLEELFKNHNHVLLTGGSGLYLDALLKGFDDLPSSIDVRQSLIALHHEMGLQPLLEELIQFDPEYFHMVDRDNPHRIIRALEVCRVSGQKYSELRKGKEKSRAFDVVKIGLTSDREWLYNRINQRVDQMISNGLLEEVKSLWDYRHLNALNTVGYKEIFDTIEGKHSFDQAIDKIKQHTRNYAKRQLTWWRREEDIHWIRIDQSTNPIAEALEIIKN